MKASKVPENQNSRVVNPKSHFHDKMPEIRTDAINKCHTVTASRQSLSKTSEAAGQPALTYKSKSRRFFILRNTFILEVGVEVGFKIDI